MKAAHADLGVIFDTDVDRGAAVDSLGEPDREIFQRRYFLYQKTEDIAREMGLGHAAVRSRLMRGRTKLREYLEKGGWAYANQNH